MDRAQMWAKARDWRTPPEEKKRLLQMLHQGPARINAIGSRSCAKCKKKLR